MERVSYETYDNMDLNPSVNQVISVRCGACKYIVSKQMEQSYTVIIKVKFDLIFMFRSLKQFHPQSQGRREAKER